jgi:hypothetical protein
MVSLPSAGIAFPDSEGYFQVTLSAEQLERLLAEKPGRNIYVPHSSERGRSTATMTYPANLLSQDKSKAGVVRIPRPEAPKKELPAAQSRLGRPIPGFEGIRFEAFQADQAKGKPLLVCFWDIDQRASRRCLQTLHEHKDELRDRNLIVLTIHCGTQPPEQISSWLREEKISLTIGRIEADPHDTLLAWGAKGMPWLVLTDERHTITNEGFGLEEFLADK